MTPVSDPRPRRRWSGQGQSLVEFALVIPVMLLLLAGAIDLGRLFYAYVAVENAAKEGAFFGSRSPLCDDASTAGCSNPNNVVWHVQNEATNIGSQFATTVACRTPGGALVQPINDCLDGYTYQVTVSYPFRLLTPILGSIVNQNLTLSAESQATVISDAFDPSGLEVLVWASSTGADNVAAISTACTQADATNAPTYYYAPCQDASNVNNFLTYPENTTVSYRVRVRNTGNLALTGIAYTWSANGTNMAAQGNCSSLPTSIGAGAAPAYCTFTRSVPAVNPVNGFADYTIAASAQGNAGGLSTSLSNGAATVRVIPAPKLAVNLKASPYRLGGIGYGTSGSPTFPSGPLTLQRNASATQAELQSPTGWLYFTVVNQGSPANAFTVSVTRNGAAVSLPCTVPASLAASGQGGSSFTCTIPQSFTVNGLATFVATASATNAVIVGGQQPSVAVTTASSCNGNDRVVPNLVDTLTPTADGTNKTVLQARNLWTAAAFTTTVATNPAGAANTLNAFTQSQTAYTCLRNNQPVTVVAQ